MFVKLRFKSCIIQASILHWASKIGAVMIERALHSLKLLVHFIITFNFTAQENEYVELKWLWYDFPWLHWPYFVLFLNAHNWSLANMRAEAKLWVTVFLTHKEQFRYRDKKNSTLIPNITIYLTQSNFRNRVQMF